MLFNSLEYAAFLVVVFVVYWLLPNRARPRFLLLASLVFYGSWDLRLLILLAVVSGTSWLAGLAIPRLEGAKRAWMTCGSVAVSVSAVLAFRAYGFFVHDVSTSSAPTAFGGGVVRVAIPVGLAFITFQTISYVVDIHRRVIEPTRSFADYTLFVTFFPHLLAGPIMRAAKLIPAFHSVPDRPDGRQLGEGCELLLVGLFKKVALADPILGLVTRRGQDLSSIGSANLWLLWLLGLAGAYFDITGYIDMARGSAKVLGINLQPNAVQPLLRSSSLGDFWRRWQVTVMMWFRDYVFLPVRGRRRGVESRELLGLMATFLALALWHGTTLNWAIWGLLTGGVVVAERTWQTHKAADRRRERLRARRLADRRERRRSRSAPAEGDTRVRTAPFRPLAGSAATDEGVAGMARRAGKLGYVYLMLILTLPWIGSPTIAATLDTYRGLFGFRGGALDGDSVGFFFLALVALVLLDNRERARERLSGRSADPPTLLRAVGYGAMLVGIVIFGATPTEPFIYLRF